jgi:hypothetical protein
MMHGLQASLPQLADRRSRARSRRPVRASQARRTGDTVSDTSIRVPIIPRRPCRASSPTIASLADSTIAAR